MLIAYRWYLDLQIIQVFPGVRRPRVDNSKARLASAFSFDNPNDYRYSLRLSDNHETDITFGRLMLEGNLLRNAANQGGWIGCARG
jgi:hypothetical protein